ncbi:MAG: YjjG family noncanonical pyrimidine nucleotidase [Flavitalea sp.]
MKYRHLFFDLDHTLWDFNANARLTLADLYHELELEKNGVHDFELFYSSYLVQNEKLWARYRGGFIKAEELRWKRMWHTLLEFKIGDEKLAKRLGYRFLELLPNRNLLFPDTINTLAFLKDKGYQLHLITNGFEATQHHKLKSSRIDHFFQEVITSEGSNSIKPKKEIFDYALRKANAIPSNSIMIGDSIEADIQGAINAGIDQVFVNHTHEVCAISPTYMVYSLAELKTIF